MHITTNAHLSKDATVSAHIGTNPAGEKYLVLRIMDGSVIPDLALFPDDPAFLDKLANECERAVREFVGDVPQENVA